MQKELGLLDLQCSLAYLSVVMINHDIMRLNISVHYTHTVTVVKSLTTQNNNKQINNYLNRIKNTNNYAQYTM